MDYYYNEFSKLKNDFYDVIRDYPLFLEMVRDIEDKDIKEINELLDKNDEYYLKKAIDKLERLIDYVKDTSKTIQKEYEKFDKLAREWEKIEIVDATEKDLKTINDKVKKTNTLINKHTINDLKQANEIMHNLIKDNK